MSVTAFQDLPLADRDREWDGAAAEKRVRRWADADDEPNEKYRDAHVWYDSDKKDNFTAYKLLIADVINDRLTAVPRGVMAAAAVMQGSRRAHGVGSISPETTLIVSRVISASITPRWTTPRRGSATSDSCRLVQRRRRSKTAPLL
jgi:hypothetical protein